MSDSPKPENREEPSVALQDLAPADSRPFALQASQPLKLLTGDLLRRLFRESTVPLSDMQTEAEVASWWKHYAGRVRNALNGGIGAAPKGRQESPQTHLQAVTRTPPVNPASHKNKLRSNQSRAQS